MPILVHVNANEQIILVQYCKPLLGQWNFNIGPNFGPRLQCLSYDRASSKICVDVTANLKWNTPYKKWCRSGINHEFHLTYIQPVSPRWPLTSSLLRSHVWLYPRFIMSKSHENTSKYVDTVINFAKIPHTTYILRTYYIRGSFSKFWNMMCLSCCILIRGKLVLFI